MITPAHKLKEKECVLLVALDPINAEIRYKTIVNRLKPFEYSVIDDLGSSVLASVTTENPSELETILLEILERKDEIFVIHNLSGRLNIQVILHRAEDDNEIRSLAEFWKPVWKK